MGQMFGKITGEKQSKEVALEANFGVSSKPIQLVPISKLTDAEIKILLDRLDCGKKITLLKPFDTPGINIDELCFKSVAQNRPFDNFKNFANEIWFTFRHMQGKFYQITIRGIFSTGNLSLNKITIEDAPSSLLSDEENILNEFLIICLNFLQSQVVFLNSEVLFKPENVIPVVSKKQLAYMLIKAKTFEKEDWLIPIFNRRAELCWKVGSEKFELTEEIFYKLMTNNISEWKRFLKNETFLTNLLFAKTTYIKTTDKALMKLSTIKCKKYDMELTGTVNVRAFRRDAYNRALRKAFFTITFPILSHTITETQHCKNSFYFSQGECSKDIEDLDISYVFSYLEKKAFRDRDFFFGNGVLKKTLTIRRDKLRWGVSIMRCGLGVDSKDLIDKVLIEVVFLEDFLLLSCMREIEFPKLRKVGTTGRAWLTLKLKYFLNGIQWEVTTNRVKENLNFKEETFFKSNLLDLLDHVKDELKKFSLKKVNWKIKKVSKEKSLETLNYINNLHKSTNFEILNLLNSGHWEFLKKCLSYVNPKIAKEIDEREILVKEDLIDNDVTLNILHKYSRFKDVKLNEPFLLKLKDSILRPYLYIYCRMHFL